MTPRMARALYFALAIAAGILVATSLLPWPTDFVLLLIVAFAAIQVRRRVLRPQRPLILELQFLGVFAVVWLGLAWALRAWPFR